MRTHWSVPSEPEQKPGGWWEQPCHGAGGDGDGVAHRDLVALPMQRAGMVLEIDEPVRRRSRR